MHGCIGRLTPLLLLTLTASPALGQLPRLEDPPKLFVPKLPRDPAEIARRAALHQYVLGLVLDRDQRPLEALKAFEESLRLDPKAAAVHKAQVPILVALDRGADAVAACKQCLALDPEDYAAWHIAARLHKALGEFTDAQKALERGLATTSVKEHPEAAQSMWLDLGGLQELDADVKPAVRAFTAAVAILDQPDALMEHGRFPREAILARAAETHERIGDLQRRAKKYPEAIAAYQKAQERAPEAAAARLNFTVASLCAEQGRFAEALEHLDAYLRRQPLGTEPYEMRVTLLGKLGRQRDILPWLEEIAQKDRYNLGLRTLLAKEYVRAGRVEPAEKALVALAQEAPSEEIYKSLFELYRTSKNMEPALGLVNATVTLASRRPAEPGSAQAAQQARAMLPVLRGARAVSEDLVRVAARSERKQPLSFETLHFLATFADQQRQLDEAEKLYREALASAPADKAAPVYAGLFRALWKARKTDAILELCQDGLAKTKGPGQLVFHMEHAKVLARGERHREALAAADLALKSAADDQRFAVEHLRVRILAQADRFEEAETACHEMLKQRLLPSDQQEIRYLLSNVYNSWKKMSACEEQLETILRSDPENATANNDLGYIWADQNKKLDEAEALIRKAIEVDREQRKRAGVDGEDNAAYIDSLGWVLYRRGKIDAALRELQRAAKLPDGDDPVIFDHLGDVYQRLMRGDEARASWRRALELYDQQRRRKSDEKIRELERKLAM